MIGGGSSAQQGSRAGTTGVTRTAWQAAIAVTKAGRDAMPFCGRSRDCSPRDMRKGWQREKIDISFRNLTGWFEDLLTCAVSPIGDCVSLPKRLRQNEGIIRQSNSEKKCGVPGPLACIAADTRISGAGHLQFGIIGRVDGFTHHLWCDGWAG